MAFNLHIPPLDRTPALVAAEQYAERGWCPIPAHSVLASGHCTCGDLRCSNIGKHPKVHFSGIDSVSKGQIADWWRCYPVPNVALRTGRGLVVIDVDNKPTPNGLTGVGNFARLIADHGRLPPTPTVLTPSGGHHYYWSSQTRIHNYQGGSKLVAGVDVRGENGIVIAPPSRHRNGNLYEWKSGHSPSEVSLSPMPPWLLELCVASPMPASGERVASAGWKIPLATPTTGSGVILAGMRHDALMRLAGCLRNFGMGEVEIKVTLHAVNRWRCSPPKDVYEVNQIVAWIMTRACAGNSSLPIELVAHERMGRLAELASSLAGKAMQMEELAVTMVEVNARRCKPPLEDERLVDLILSGLLSVRGVTP